MTRTVKELKKWLSQFRDDSAVWAYEGEVCGVIVGQDEEDYCFHNELSGVWTMTILKGKKWENHDENLSCD